MDMYLQGPVGAARFATFMQGLKCELCCREGLSGTGGVRDHWAAPAFIARQIGRRIT